MFLTGYGVYQCVMSDWVSITVRESTRERFNKFIDNTGLSSRDIGLQTLLDLRNVIEKAEGDVDEMINESASVVLASHEVQKSDVVTVGGMPGVILPDRSQSPESFAILGATDHTSGEVYCPVCWNEVFSYDLDDRYPALDSVFSSVDMYCPACESKRDEFTLIRADTDPAAAEVGTDGLYDHANRYWISRILRDGLTNDVFVDRVSSYRRVINDRGEQWLPNPHKWLGMRDLRYVGDVSITDYMVFLKRYLANIQAFEGGVTVHDVFYDDRTPMQCCGTHNEHLHMLVDSQQGARDVVKALMNHWVDVKVHMNKTMDVFPEDADGIEYRLELHGIENKSSVSVESEGTATNVFED